MGGTLWLVGTPIGNLGDLAPRAREVLAVVDVIAAEDTRRSGRLLKGLAIRKPLVSFFEGNERERTEELLGQLRQGSSVALVTDGGMPSVSDPGFRLVRACSEEGVDVRVVPGPSAVLAALVVSGLPTDRFAFEGFLPKKSGERKRRLADLRTDARTLVLFESPLRVKRLLGELLDAFGDRRIAVARELTKLHEEIYRGRVSEVLAELGESELKGEVAVVIQGATDDEVPDMNKCVEEARGLVGEGLKKREAARTVAARHGVSSNDLYRALTQKVS
jgi:16S rRNA (cytidine1402-2'-O)-methyltransferase